MLFAGMYWGGGGGGGGGVAILGFVPPLDIIISLRN